MKSKLRSSTYLHFIRHRGSVQAGPWFNSVYSQLQAPLDFNLFSSAYSGTRRRIGTSQITYKLEDEGFLPIPLFLPFKERTWDELGRACLLLRAIECLSEEDHSPFISKLYQGSDNYEQQALLRSLMILPLSTRYLATAIEACRTNVKTVFEAIACENTYPFHHFPISNFNQMVLKALFIGISLKRIVGLDKRLNPQLNQMVRDFASERKTAGRLIPEDIGLILSHQE